MYIAVWLNLIVFVIRVLYTTLIKYGNALYEIKLLSLYQLDQLEPQVPIETAGDDDEDDADIEPVDETDEEEEIARPPVEKVPEIPAPVEQQPPERVPAKNEMESDLVVEHPEEAKDEGLVGEGGAQDDGVETDGEWGEEEAVNEGIMPYRDPVDDDLYLRKLIVQVSTVAYM